MAELKVKTMKENQVEVERGFNFWADKETCWNKCHCPEMIQAECAAVKYQFLPCWEIEGTYCKLNEKGATGKDTTVCQTCQVYKKYGNGEPISIKLFGRGMDVSLKGLVKATK
jgi:hypothetical protein